MLSLALPLPPLLSLALPSTVAYNPGAHVPLLQNAVSDTNCGDGGGVVVVFVVFAVVLFALVVALAASLLAVSGQLPGAFAVTN